MNMQRRIRGFTLIELMVTITIIGILATLVTVAVLPIQRRSRDAKRKADVNLLLSAANQFYADFKIYPNYTFYLGDYGTSANGGANSNLNLSNDIPSCDNLNDGSTANFLNLNGGTVATAGKPTSAEVSAQPYLLKQGFASVNNFLVCMKYMDRLVKDPSTSQSGASGYQYRVSYDYQNILVSAKLENSNDPDNKNLFYVNPTTKHYYEGNGKNVRQLDEDSNVPATGGGFYASETGTVNDGSYLYQCSIDGTGAAITPDNRIGTIPIISSGSSWAKNSNCQDSAGALNNAQGW